MNKKVQIFIEKIKNAKSIAISGHKNLDGDALCSALALMKIIELNFGKKATVIYDGNVPRELDNVPLREDAVFYKNLPENSNYDLYILVDYGTRKHLGGVEKYVNSADFVIEFDHHFNDDLVGNLCFDNEKKAATSQIIYDVVKSGKFDIDQDIVDLLTLAIITDTGNFKFVRNSDVFKDAASLVDAGADMTRLVNLLSNKDKKTVLHGVQYVVLLKEQKEERIGVSIRSREIPINKIAESFGGGGHLCAAGAVIEDSLQNVHDKVINAFKGM